MKKTLIFSVLSLLFLAQTFAAVTPARTLLFRSFQQNNMAVAYDVRIKLVNTDGNPVPGNPGLRGFWARNEQTGVYYYPTDDREGSEFAALPPGTYTFGAYPGYWDGALSKTVILDGSQEGPDGFTEVTLVYWVE
jgi:hypothetical protein